MATRSTVAVVREPQHADIALWREVFAGVDYVKLKASSTYYGFGVPHGRGDAVVIVPGFLGNDWYLVEMYLWLQRMGYKPYFSRIGHNATCPDKLIHRLMNTVNRAYADTGRPVHLIGHSFGGVLARGVAVRKPERIASLTTMGSPFAGIRVNPWVLWAIGQVRKRAHRRGRDAKACFTDACACGFLCTMNNYFPSSIMQTAIYTRSDGVVDWEACINNDPDTDYEVSGTHIGLAWNPQVYRIIAQRLHQAAEKQRLRDIGVITESTPGAGRKRRAGVKPRSKAAQGEKVNAA
jgi:triacylglycerol lipase